MICHIRSEGVISTMSMPLYRRERRLVRPRGRPPHPAHHIGIRFPHNWARSESLCRLRYPGQRVYYRLCKI